ncbi:MAG: hypothetical protein ACON5F_13820 [Jejuia sp.]
MKQFKRLFIGLLFSSSTCFSQSQVKDSLYYNLFDAYSNSLNKGFINGSEYIDVYPESPLEIENNNKFYQSYNYLNGSIVYNGQPYFNVKMKYDLLNDLLVMEFVNNGVNRFSLNPELVTEFRLLDSKFIRLNDDNIGIHYKNGFFKESLKGKKLSFFVKYHKEKFEDLTEKRKYYKFKERRFYFMYYDNSFYRISSKRDILKALPDFEKPIKGYFKNNSRLFKKNKEQFLHQLFKYLDNLNTNDPTKV